MLKGRSLGVGLVRLLPKETGVRPIVNLRRKTKGGKDELQKTLKRTSSKDATKDSVQVGCFRHSIQAWKTLTTQFSSQKILSISREFPLRRVKPACADTS